MISSHYGLDHGHHVLSESSTKESLARASPMAVYPVVQRLNDMEVTNHKPLEAKSSTEAKSQSITTFSFGAVCRFKIQ
ncbi:MULTISPECIES: hypothetical protein [Micrococcaceae]|uniref:Uncharacterized protein n=1 Tax=Glutamicibacter soli TaxID=453836 RepID=A0A6L9G4K2_9MICC|nr:hypothetical protein [Glutamicibacter soli]NAZ15957.1 hypothetical protein [Glutamicibacter soli]